MEKRKFRQFRHRGGILELGARTRIMGIVNVTPDSFSDGGHFLETGRAVDHALAMVSNGASIIDLGAESTRPGSNGVSDELQLERLLPVLEQIRSETDAVLSIDTQSHVVAKHCLALGADVVNDVSGLRSDDRLAAVCAEYRAGLVLMHMRGTPATMQEHTSYKDVVAEVKDSLRSSVEKALACGVDCQSIMIDPGLGFGKTFEQNYELLHRLTALRVNDTGILVGPSRKAFTGEFSRLPASHRQFSTAAAVSIAILCGADVVRVHDTHEMKQVADICDRFMELASE